MENLKNTLKRDVPLFMGMIARELTSINNILDSMGDGGMKVVKFGEAH